MLVHPHGPLTPENIDKAIQKYGSEFPVPVANMVRNLDIRLFSADLGKDHQGRKIQSETSKDEYGTYSIKFNRYAAYYENRRTLARAVARLRLYRKDLEQQEAPILYADTGMPSFHKDPQHPLTFWQEKKTWLLADEILMPEDEFIDVWADNELVTEVADYFAVPEDAAHVRAFVLQSSSLAAEGLAGAISNRVLSEAV